jgi:3-methyladenine DNA glycosylase AlkD
LVGGRPRLRGWAASERQRLVRELRGHAGPGESEWARSYLGSPVPVWGVRAPELRSVARDASKRIRARPLTEVHALVRSLWAGRSFEERIVAIELLRRRPLAHDERTWGLADDWVDSATGWALSDSLAGGPIADLLADHPERFAALLTWTRSDNLWRRRASTYALRPWIRAADLEPPLRLLERLLEDPERWVQRAVGTWLRECWKKDRTRTEKFLRRHVNRLTPVALTVATERAPRRVREQLRRASRRRRSKRRGF